MQEAFGRIADELRAGELVCVFPEGKLTQTGELGPFRNGIERIVTETPVPVIPMHLRGLWGSLFSRERSRRPFRRMWSRVELAVGAPIAPEAVTAAALEMAVQELGLQQNRTPIRQPA